MPHVLTLDDQPSLIELYGVMLQRAGYRHTGTTDPLFALDIMRKGGVDLLIQDVARPRMDGVALCLTMRADPTVRGIPVLICSGSCQVPTLTTLLGARGTVLLPTVFPAFRGRWLVPIIARLRKLCVMYVDGRLPKPASYQDLTRGVAEILIRRGLPLP